MFVTPGLVHDASLNTWPHSLTNFLETREMKSLANGHLS